MNRKIRSLISNGLCISGSWSQLTSPFWRRPLSMNRGCLSGERGRPGCTGRRLADRNQAGPPPRGFGGTPNPAGETPALPIAPSGSGLNSRPIFEGVPYP